MVTFFLLALLFILLLLLLLFLFNPFPAMCQIGREGEWCLLHASIGISTMHVQLLHNNKVVMFDRTNFGPSNLDRYVVLLWFHPPRWYATNQRLPDGRIIIIGGRKEFNYEFYPRNSESSSSFWLEFLRETRDNDENNLYPFVHLLPDGNLFIFANTRAISLDYKQNRVVKEFPSITVDYPRNYPSSSSSVLLLIDENEPIEAEVMVCGSAPRGEFSRAKQGIFDAVTRYFFPLATWSSSVVPNQVLLVGKLGKTWLPDW
ncbi:Aldehyde oxidase GLOX [Camellia lanceoleosa]|uniref:Aldehyde oxidase GLOX n=1 Tax=Camellia lanceoleosa TaxID=1840588 RepID=A0ACC0IKI7_9ERIC|nr:Aldehyde oxidase GLOX [Camellia lanceoleosa]